MPFGRRCSRGRRSASLVTEPTEPLSHFAPLRPCVKICSSMWPFASKPKVPPPADVIHGGVTAHYDVKFKYWSFNFDGLEFKLSGIPFNPMAIEWAKEAA